MSALTDFPEDHVRHIRRIANRVRRDYTCGRSYRRCHGAAIDLETALKKDTHIAHLGISCAFAGGAWDGGAHCWVHLEHPDWPEPLAVDVTLDQFHFEVASFDRDPQLPRQPAVFVGPYTDTKYSRIVAARL